MPKNEYAFFTYEDQDSMLPFEIRDKHPSDGNAVPIAAFSQYCDAELFKNILSVIVNDHLSSQEVMEIINNAVMEKK